MFRTLRWATGLAVLVLNAMMLLQACDDPQLPCRIELVKADDRANQVFDNGALDIDLHSKTGIGKASLFRTAEKWPDTLLLKLHLTGLEHFAVTAGKTTIHASVTSHGEQDQHAQQILDAKEVPLSAIDPLWPPIRVIDKDGKPAGKVPLKNGYFEITLPKKMLDENPDFIKLEWIDFYRG